MKTLNKLLLIGFTAFVLVALLQISPVFAIASCQVDSDCGPDYWQSQYCRGNDIYGEYVKATCNKPSDTNVGSCTYPHSAKQLASCNSPQICQEINTRAECNGPISPKPNPTPNSYTYHYYTRCDTSNSIYWFDSNNNRQDIYQTCSNGSVCSGNTCGTAYQPPPPYNPPAPYTPPYNAHQLKGCIGNTSYWYDSLGNKKEVYKSCSITGQTCDEGLCTGPVVYYPNPPVPKPTPAPTENAYALNYVTQCNNNDIYWFDSKDVRQNLFMSCSDGNQCTLDTCGDGQCKHLLQCDGSTCSAGSADYIKYCASTAAVSENGFAKFLGHWLIWIILAIIMIVLFIIIFRRLSKNN